MFEFIKRLFKKSEVKKESTGPVLVHADIGEAIVIKEVKLKAPAKPRTTKEPTELKAKKEKEKEVKTAKPVAKAKSAKPAKAPKVKEVKEPTKADALSNIVQLVPPAEKKKGRPKKDKTV